MERTGREQDAGDSGTSRNSREESGGVTCCSQVSNDTGRDVTTLRSTSDLHHEGFMGHADL